MPQVPTNSEKVITGREIFSASEGGSPLLHPTDVPQSPQSGAWPHVWVHSRMVLSTSIHVTLLPHDLKTNSSYLSIQSPLLP